MFFNEDVINEVFQDWNILYMKEYEVGRFDRSKRLWELAMQPGD